MEGNMGEKDVEGLWNKEEKMGQIRLWQKGNYLCPGIEWAGAWGNLVQGGESIHKDNLEWERTTNATKKKKFMSTKIDSVPKKYML